jgi:hypothetical protein
VDPRDDLDDVQKRNFLTLPALELQPLSSPARSESLFPLRYPGSMPLYSYKGLIKAKHLSRGKIWNPSNWVVIVSIQVPE